MKLKLSKFSIVILFSGIAFLFLLYFQRNAVLQRQYDEQFKNDAKELAVSIFASMNLKKEVLASISNFFASSLNVNEWEFHNFTNDMLLNLDLLSVCYFGEDGRVYKTLKNRKDNCGKFQKEASSGFDVETRSVFLFQEVSSVDGTIGRALMVFRFDSLIPRGLLDGFLKDFQVHLVTSKTSQEGKYLTYFHNEPFISQNKINYFIQIDRPEDFSSLNISFDYILVLSLFAALLILIIYIIESGLQREKLVAIKVKSQERVLKSQYDEIETQKKIANKNERLASIGVLAAGIGHEINNPLTIIMAHLDKLKGLTKEKSELRKRVEKVESSAVRIKKIVSALRRFSRQSRGGDDAEEENEFNVRDLLEDTVSMLKDLYEKDGIRLKLHLDIDERLFVNGDRGKFQQVLINLISNAKDAVENRKNGEINVFVKSRKEMIYIVIEDNGEGISRAQQEKIFDLFYTTKDVGRGTGIGLSLSREFVQDLFHGTIKVKSALGRGSSFEVKIPAFIKTIIEEKNIEEDKAMEKLECIKCGVLLVDDEEGIRDLLKEILVEHGLHVEVASEGREALDIYLNNPKQYDIIITDLKMPIMDGPQLIREIRHKKNIKQPKIILASGCVDLSFENENKDLNEYIDGLIYKPFSEEDLIEQINNVMKEEEFKSAA